MGYPHFDRADGVLGEPNSGFALRLEEKWVLEGKSEFILSHIMSSSKDLASFFGARGTRPAGSILGDDVPKGAAPKGGTSALANARRQSVAEP